MLSAILSLKIREEVTVFRQDSIERRVRRVRNYLYQIYDINWQHYQCWHLAYELSANLAWKVTRHAPSVFRTCNAFAPVAKAPRAQGYQSKENLKLKQRVFHDARKRVARASEIARPKLVAVAGGRR